MRRVALLLLAAAGFGCQGRDEAPKPAAQPASATASQPASAAKARASDGVRAAWRASVKYRRAHEALAKNGESLVRDVARTQRMLEETEALKRVPVVADVAADAKAVETLLTTWLAGARLKGTVTVGAAPSAPPPAATAETKSGFDYAPGQVSAAHPITLRLQAKAADGRRLLTSKDELGRLVAITAVKPVPGGFELTGSVPFFRPLTPVRFVRSTVDVEAALKAAKVGATGKDAEVAARVRKNYAAVDGLKADLDKALAQQALLKINTARFSAYREVLKAYDETGWDRLTGAAPKAGHEHHGHGH